MIHTVKGFSIVNEADFFWNSLAFSVIQWMLTIWSLVPLPLWNSSCTSGSSLKPSMKDFEHYLASMWNEHNCAVVWTFFFFPPSLGLERKLIFSQSYGHCWIFQICQHTECSIFTASSFRIWNSSTGILSLPLLLLLLLNRFSRVRLCATPQTAAHQALLSLGFSRQEHWSGLLFPSPVHESEKWKWSRSVVSDS